MTKAFPILTFHAVDDRASVLSFPPRLFQQGMARLHESGYKTLNLPQIVEHLRQRVAFPERSFAITFDDGYQSVYNRASPVLQRYGFSATVFLSVGESGTTTGTERLPRMEGRSMLSWREIKEMHRWGIAFGGHTLTHPDLTRLPAERIEAEVVGGKRLIEDALGSTVDTFAYPFGRHDKRCRELVSRHFLCACSDRLGLLRSNTDFYAMDRVDAYYLRSERLFRAMLTSFFPFYIQARSIPRLIRRALRWNIRP